MSQVGNAQGRDILRFSLSYQLIESLIFEEVWLTFYDFIGPQSLWHRKELEGSYKNANLMFPVDF